MGAQTCFLKQDGSCYSQEGRRYGQAEKKEKEVVAALIGQLADQFS